jgi:arylamine N-acetyltransferase
MISLTFVLLLSLPAAGPVLWHEPPSLAGEATKAVCPVCGTPIEAGKGLPVTVRERDYLVDSPRCAEALAANPDQYLAPDGTPRNTKKTPVAQ